VAKLEIDNSRLLGLQIRAQLLNVYPDDMLSVRDIASRIEGVSEEEVEKCLARLITYLPRPLRYKAGTKKWGLTAHGVREAGNLMADLLAEVRATQAPKLSEVQQVIVHTLYSHGRMPDFMLVPAVMQMMGKDARDMAFESEVRANCTALWGLGLISNENGVYFSLKTGELSLKQRILKVVQKAGKPLSSEDIEFRVWCTKEAAEEALKELEAENAVVREPHPEAWRAVAT
jgi:hypothetical protein